MVAITLTRREAIAMGDLEETGITSGRCPACEMGFVWRRGWLRLRDARCPFCKLLLHATVHYAKPRHGWAYLKVWPKGHGVFSALS